MKYKEPATWLDTRDEAIDLTPLTPEYADACLEYRELRERQLQRKLTESDHGKHISSPLQVAP